MSIELNGYTLMQRLQKARKKHAISATAQALFHELTAECNEVEWATVFTVRNQELSGALCITENTLIKARLELIDAGLLSYRSGKSRMAPSDYSFNAKKFPHPTTSKFEGVSSTTVRTTSGTTSDFDTVPEVVEDLTTSKFEDINTQTSTVEPKEKTRNRNGSAPSGASAPKKNEATLHWPALIEAWFAFNKENFNGFEPSFKGDDPKKLKSIADNLQKRVERQGGTWTEATAVQSLTGFLKYAAADKWLNSNFLLSNLDKQLDKLLKDAVTGKTPNGHSQSSELNADHKRDVAERMARFAGKGG